MIKLFRNFLVCFSLLGSFFVFLNGVESSNHQQSVDFIPSDGSWITLSDGTLYQISPADWQVVSRWNDGRTQQSDVMVINTRNGNLDYPIDIYNKFTGETVRARYPATVDNPPSEEAPSEDDESD